MVDNKEKISPHKIEGFLTKTQFPLFFVRINGPPYEKN